MRVKAFGSLFLACLGVPILTGAKGGCDSDYVSVGHNTSGTAGMSNTAGGMANAAGGMANAAGGDATGGGNPTPILQLSECTALGGIPTADPGDGSLLRAGCPTGSTNLGMVSGFIEGGLCCAPAPVSIPQCRAMGGEPLSDPGDGSLLRAGCPDQRRMVARMADFDEGGLCCTRTLPSVNFSECRLMGGAPISDPGDGSVLRKGCPDERELIAEAVDRELALCCQLPLVSGEACQEMGGEIFGDIGDGSLIRAGCPNDRPTLAFVSGFIEGGLCCGP